MANSSCCLSHGSPDCDKQVIMLLQNGLACNSNLSFDTYSQTDSRLPAFFWNVSFKLLILFASGLLLFGSLLTFHYLEILLFPTGLFFFVYLGILV